MELLYVKIKKYRNLEDIAFNFSNEYNIKISDDYELFIEKKEKFIPQFWSNNITNLTAIVGENGIGKTTILRYLVEFLSYGLHGNEDTSSIIISKDKNEIIYYSLGNLKLKSSDISINLVKGQDIEDFKFPLQLIYLSNNVNPIIGGSDPIRSAYGNFRNLSSSYLMYHDYQNLTGEDALNSQLTYDDRMNAFSSMEMMRMVRLLRWINQRQEKNKIFPAKIPPYLNILIESNSEIDINTNNFNIGLRNYFGKISKRSDELLINILNGFFKSIYNDQKFVSGPDKIKQAYLDILESTGKYLIENNSIEGSVYDGILKLIENLKRTLSGPSKDIAYLEFDSFLQFLGKLNEFSKTRNLISYYGISILLTEANLKSLTELVDSYYNANRISNYIHFAYGYEPFQPANFSSGEYAFFLIFARLYSIKPDDKKTLLILIDEAELALHPQWQKQFISIFVEFLNDKFSKNNVQIVFTSHSPFILSDIPSNCVILLKKENGKTVVVPNLSNIEETFGANIHELFTDAFFLQDGLIGEFSRAKINELIQEINNVNIISKEDYLYKYKARIDIIGEQFIKAKILELIVKKIDDVSFIDTIIDQRSDEIKRLNEIKSNRQNDQNRK